MPRETPYNGLLKIRTWHRDQSSMEVHATERELQELVRRIDELSNSINRWSNERRKLQSGLVKLQEWKENEAYRAELIDQKNRLVLQLMELQAKLNDQRSILLEHEKELKQIEKIIEHQLLNQQEQQRAADQAQLDEWASAQARISRTTLP